MDQIDQRLLERERDRILEAQTRFAVGGWKALTEQQAGIISYMNFGFGCASCYAPNAASRP